MDQSEPPALIKELIFTPASDYSILYIDDDPAMREVTSLFLQRKTNFRITVASDAIQGLKIYKCHKFDAIISDYEMPEMNGIGLLKKLRSEGDMIPFILFTGRGREEVVIEALNCGADFYLQKGGQAASQYSELSHMVRSAIERYKTGIELQRSKHQISGLIDHLPDATFAVDTSGRVVAWNKAMEIFSGVPAQDMLGKGDYTYAEPLYGHKRPLLLNHLLNPDEKIPQYYEKVELFPDSITAKGYLNRSSENSSTIWIKSSLYYDHTGQIAGAVETVRDISEKVQSINNLKVYKQRLEEIINFLPDATFALNLKGEVVAWNRAMEKLTGIPKREILGKGGHIYSISIQGEQRLMLIDYLRENSPVPHDRYHEIEQTWDAVSAEGSFTKNNGEVIHYWASASLLYTPSGQVSGAIESIRDITRRKNLELELSNRQTELARYCEKISTQEEEIRESYRSLLLWQNKLENSEKKFRTLVETNRELVFLLRNEKFEYLNPSGCLILGYSKEELSGLRFVDLVHPEDQPYMHQYLEQLGRGEAHDPVIVKIQTKTGQGTLCRISCEKVISQGLPAIIGRGQEILDQFRESTALMQANKKLRLLAGITRHDIGNHVTTLYISLDILTKMNLPPECKELLDCAFRSGNALKDDVNFLAGYQDGGMGEPEWLSVFDCFNLCSDLLITTDINFECFIPKNLEIYSDPLFLKVCQNLIDNTIRHGQMTGELSVTTEEKSGELVIRVKDDGLGVPDSEKEKIFLRGYGKNTGFGLYLSSEILSITGITIIECGDYGKNSCFEIRIPPGSYRFR